MGTASDRMGETNLLWKNKFIIYYASRKRILFCTKVLQVTAFGFGQNENIRLYLLLVSSFKVYCHTNNL